MKFFEEDVFKRIRIAAKTTNSEELAILAKDINRVVRCSVASNPHTPIEILEELKKDKDGTVKEVACANLAMRK